MSVGIRSGAIPALNELITAFEGSEGATVRSYDATATWTSRLDGLKNKMASYVTGNPAVLQAIGGVAAGIGGLVLVLPTATTLFKALWIAALGPAGAVAAAIGAVAVGVGLLIKLRGTEEEQNTRALAQLPRLEAQWQALNAVIQRRLDAGSAISDQEKRQLKRMSDQVMGLRELKRVREAETAEMARAAAEAQRLAEEIAGGGGSVGPGLVPAVEEATDALPPLTSGVTALDDRLKEARDQIRGAVNDLVGDQGLASGFQRTTRLMSRAIDVELRQLPRAVTSGFQRVTSAATTGVQNMIGTMRSHFTTENVTGIFAAAFEGGGQLLGAIRFVRDASHRRAVGFDRAGVGPSRGVGRGRRQQNLGKSRRLFQTAVWGAVSGHAGRSGNGTRV